MKTTTRPWDYRRVVGIPDNIKCPKCNNLAVMQQLSKDHKCYYCFGCGIIDLAPDHDAIIDDAKQIAENRRLLLEERIGG